MRICFLQVRHDQISVHEIRCFCEKTGFDSKDFNVVNVFQKKPDFNDLDDCRALIIGGSGSYYVSNDTIPELTDAMGKCILEAQRRKIPTLGVCYGAHLIARVFGGKVIQNESKKEVGSYRIYTTENAKNDKLFENAPKQFIAQLGHKDGIVKLPENAIKLAYSDLWDVQAFVIENGPIYAIQFHPELDRESVQERIIFYQNDYAFSVVGSPSEIIEKLEDCPESNALLKRFFELFLK